MNYIFCLSAWLVHRCHARVLSTLLLLCCWQGVQASILDKFIDPQDGQFDTSDWLLNNNGFLPVPIIVTEPAVGEGLGAALLFFHERKSGADVDDDVGPAASGNLVPPSISGLAGLATNNGSRLAAGFHMGIWKQDHVRYVGALARASMNLTYYPTENGGTSEDAGLEFTIDGDYLSCRAMAWAASCPARGRARPGAGVESPCGVGRAGLGRHSSG